MIPIAHSKPTISTLDRKNVDRVIQSGHLAQGKQVADFEHKLSRYVGVKGGVAVNSGTSALHLSLVAMGIGPGDEVIVPSYVCSALLNPIQYVGAKARVADVHPYDFNIAPLDAWKKINKKTKAIIVPHMFGCPANLKELARLGVPLIEDCAQAIGASYDGKKVGAYGVVSICSFYATKVMTTGEGGMVLSNARKLLDKIKDLRAYDNAIDYKARYNYKMTDMQAALGLSQLGQLPSFIEQRAKIAKIYTQVLKERIGERIGDTHLFQQARFKRGAEIGVCPQFFPPDADRTHIYFRYVVKVDGGVKRLMQKLHNKGIQAAQPVFKPLHRYLSYDPCPVADQLMDQCLSIPIYPSLTTTQARYIAQHLRE